MDQPMSQSLAKNTIHLVFSTKARRPWLHERVRPRLYAYLSGIFEQWESPAIVIGGYEDHVHALFLLSKNHPLKKVVEEVKKGSSKWIKTVSADLAGFSWQNGYGAFSVSESNIADVTRYIERQPDHHRRMTFQDELRQLLARHGIEADERHVWT
jgi:REP element-mobilizing transposase RayT